MGKVIAIDLDGVLCEEGKWDIKSMVTRKPLVENIKKINRLYDEGNIIVIWTGRREEDRIPTEAWLKLNRVKYHYLVMQKPYYELIIEEKKKLLAIEDVGEDNE